MGVEYRPYRKIVSNSSARQVSVTFVRRFALTAIPFVWHLYETLRNGDELRVGHFDEAPKNAEQACRLGEWMDKRDPLLQRSYRILVSRGAWEISPLGHAGRR